MVLPRLPSYVRLLLAGYGEAPDYGVIRSDMEGPIAKQRPRWSSPVAQLDVTLLIEGRQGKLDFEEWFGKTLAGGSGWFLYTDPISQAQRKARFIGGKIRLIPDSKGLWRAATQIEAIAA
ncbi:hypothetical protein [Chromobacterium haemolyticum]|uniref:hypothetical protein n=1 Tax=Chromobacterium haemolyticum TaxID=394935 RepID=UPI0009DB32D5|nr:hypothetical protein [Chromobacterium haemolyticum]OQS32972.1 hypothetical protein B0T39_21560 [Chromobacterium haemolyticum]